MQNLSPLDRARRKGYWRLLPILFVCYLIAYVDRTNIAIAKLTMTKDLPGFDSAVIGQGMGFFFWGYFLLEIPCAVLVEKWSARRLICRIMITWGIVAALTAAAKTPRQFYVARFCLGLAEAGFFPGGVVYLTHWFPGRDRTRALSWFLIAVPVAQIINPRISNALLKIGSDESVHGVIIHHAKALGLAGWQWVFIFWGLPAIFLGLLVYFALPDHPREAKWLSAEERLALERELENEKSRRGVARRMALSEAFGHPKVLFLTAAYFFSTTASYGVDLWLPSILEKWYSLKIEEITWLVILPPCLALASQLFVGWNADRIRERRFHAVGPILIAMFALGMTPLARGRLAVTMICFMLVSAGVKAYLPAFWSLPSLFLTEAAAAGSIGFINSIGNLGGYFGPALLGTVEKHTGSFDGGIYYLCFSMSVCAVIITLLGVGRRQSATTGNH